MKTANVLILTLAVGLVGHADFSYNTAPKDAGGKQAASGQSQKYYFKGSKMRVDNGDTATIVDFDAKMFTTINNGAKTYSVTPFSSVTAAEQQAGAGIKIDAKDTGEHRVINGYNASQLLLTATLEGGQTGRAGMPAMQLEAEIWISNDVPGVQELRSFYQRNASSLPWAAISGSENPNLRAAMIEVEKKLTSMGGVPVLRVTRVKAAGNDAQAAQMQQQMSQARARLEAMSKQGGPQAAAAQQALARMGAMGGGSGSLFESTVESKDFSTSSIPDSMFSVPAGYQKTDRK